jgi:hypothetical protein
MPGFKIFFVPFGAITATGWVESAVHSGVVPVALKYRREHSQQQKCGLWKDAMNPKNVNLDDLLTPAEFGEWIGESESWVRRRLGSIPGVIRESRKHIRIHPRTYLEKRLKIGHYSPLKTHGDFG